MLISANEGSVLESHDPATDNPIHTERRSDQRYAATYRPCCLIRGQRASMGLLRNFSSNGACVETELKLKVGDEITYFWESKLNITARVAWRNGKLFGLEHIEEVEQDGNGFPARSVRVPCSARAVCWINGERHSASVENISLGGIRLAGLPDLQFGTLMTVCFCGLEIEAATARWSDSGAVGARFRERLTRRQLAELLLDDQFSFSEIEFG
ncbi:MAG: PilZ domain-containing protein [Erythrobacter sp.]